MPAWLYSCMEEMRRLLSSLFLKTLAMPDTPLRTLNRDCIFAIPMMFLVSRTIRVLRSALAIAMLGALHGMLDRLVMDSSFRLLSMMIMRSTSPVQMMPMALKFVYIKPMSLRLRFLRLKNLRQLSLPSSRLLMPQILLTVAISFVRQRVVGGRLMSPADPSLRVRMFKYTRSMPRLRKHGPSPMTRTVS